MMGLIELYSGPIGLGGSRQMVDRAGAPTRVTRRTRIQAAMARRQRTESADIPLKDRQL